MTTTAMHISLLVTPVYLFPWDGRSRRSESNLFPSNHDRPQSQDRMHNNDAHELQCGPCRFSITCRARILGFPNIPSGEVESPPPCVLLFSPMRRGVPVPRPGPCKNSTKRYRRLEHRSIFITPIPKGLRKADLQLHAARFRQQQKLPHKTLSVAAARARVASCRPPRCAGRITLANSAGARERHATAML
jgi:hypothetical protein